MSKIILDLCGGTGAWSKPYKEAGYEVKVITLPDYDILNIRNNNLDNLLKIMKNKDNGFEWELIPYEKIYGILCAPPCTMFSLARQTAKTPRSFEIGMEIVIKCLDIIWKIRLKHQLKFWALENPRGYLRQFLGKSYFEFEQWEFGDNGIKPTDLWGYFNLPQKIVSVKPDTLYGNYKKKATTQMNICISGLTRKESRAVTPENFAQAFYKANK